MWAKSRIKYVTFVPRSSWVARYSLSLLGLLCQYPNQSIPSKVLRSVDAFRIWSRPVAAPPHLKNGYEGSPQCVSRS